MNTSSPFARLCLLLFAVLLVSGCTESDGTSAASATKQAPPIAVGTVKVKPEPLPVTNNLPGRIAPTRVAEVRPRVSGIVIERVFTQGSVVKEGDVLYRIDPAPFRIKVESAEATLKRAEAVKLQAQQQAERVRELRERNVASAQQSETAIAALAQADADVGIAKAGLAAAKLDLAYSEVTAPITGRIGRALITEGALVSSNSGESLATIQQLNPVYADFTQSAGDLLAMRRAVRQGTIESRDPDSADVRLLFDNGSEYRHPGRLLFSEATVDATTGQVTLRGEFPNPEGELLPGMYVRIVIEQGVQSDGIAVPQQAIQRDGSGRAQVYLLKPDGTLELRAVGTGRTLGNSQVIEHGLKPGEEVMVEGFQKIRAGGRFTGTPWKPADGAKAAQNSNQG